MGLVVKSEVGNYLKKKGVRTSGELYDALDKAVGDILTKAAQRARGNKRQTVMAQDL